MTASCSRRAPCGSAEIFREADDVDAELIVDGAAARLELLAVARHQNEIVPVRGKDVGERRADADRSARNQRSLLSH